VITLGELILDGRNRWQACELAGVEPVTREYTGKLSPVDYVLSQNLHRRHLTVNQRATIAAMMANMTHGGDRKSEDIKASKEALISQAEAAEKMQVSRASVQRAEYVIKNAPELAEQVKAGEVTLPQAVRQVRHAASPPLREVREHAPEDEESETMQLLKTYWKRATRKEKRAFCEWAKLI
jgi:ParB-like chromosome segregation protein Spo0J